VMKELRGRADGAMVSRILNEAMAKVRSEEPV
jgi:Glu-tRNA(Gln) amidotransferase subunit E-like FAD-binding protein